MFDFITSYEVVTVNGFIIHLIASAILGAVIGFERQWTRHAAGILTNLIVCLGSFAFTAFSFLTLQTGVDITRVAAGIVSGIGFLGAGVIMREGGNVRGLNTAATVWASSAVGILCGVTNLIYAILVAVAIVVLHLVLHPVSEKIDKMKKYDKTDKNKQEALYKISVVCPDEAELEVRNNIMSIIKNEPEALLHTLETINFDPKDGTRKIRAYITTKTGNDALIESLITKVGKNEEIISTGWKIEHE